MNPARKRRKLSTHDAPVYPSVSEGGATDEEDEFLLVEEDTTDSSLIITMDETRMKSRRRKKKQADDGGGGASESEPEIDTQLDQSLETKSKQHNLTAVNVKNILHEVITNEHVVAMMKAAINDTEAPPPFEPKMTRSKLKEVVEKGVVIPAWNLSPIKKHNDVNKPPQFVDMALADEDSSDEEYRPDEDEEDETAEDTFHESDLDSTASSPRGSRIRDDSSSPWQTSRTRARRLRVEPVPMGPPPPPKTTPTRSVSDSSRAPPPRILTDRRIVSDSTFLEKLHAVEEELSVCTHSYQPLQDSDMDLMAARTRSKRPLRDVPLGQLEAELKDFTPDFSETRSSMDPDPEEDRDWTDWLRGLMTSDVEEEADDEDDPEYNFLADTDEPDLEDYRDDRAVRITKKEVNELMEELFETLKEDLASQEVEDEGHEEEEETPKSMAPPPCVPKPPIVPVHVPVPDPDPDPGPACELRTVRQKLEFIRKHHRDVPAPDITDSVSLSLNAAQQRRLCQQIQQHVQLLTQVHLLCAPVSKLHSEAQTTRQFLVELDFLGQGAELVMSSRGFPGHRSTFRVCNLQGALQLLEETTVTPIDYTPPTPRIHDKGRIKAYPLLPGELAWIFATRPVFLYPELLPCVSLDPTLYCPRRTNAFTAAEDCLLVLGLKHLESCPDPVRLVSELILRKSLAQVRRRILQCCRPGSSDNIVKAFRFQKVLWPMHRACLPQTEERAPVEREESNLPLWITRSLPVIHAGIRRLNSQDSPLYSGPHPRSSHLILQRSDWSGPFPSGSVFPSRLPKDVLEFRRIGFVLLNPSSEASQRSDEPITEQELDGPITEQEEDGPIREQEQDEDGPIAEREEECDIVLVLSDSSLSDTGSPLSNQEPDCVSQHAPGHRTGSDFKAWPEEKVPQAQNMCVLPSAKRGVRWTREADRELLLAAKKSGANQKTFRAVSHHLGNKTPAQVALRFHDLMTLFHSSNHRAASCSPQQPIRRQEAPD